MTNKNFPYEIKVMEGEIKTLPENFVRVGPKGYVLPKGYIALASDVYNMEIRPSDVFVFTFPRSGTTWTQEMVWLIANDLDYDTAKKVPLVERFPFVEFVMTFDEETKQKLYDMAKEKQIHLKDFEMLRKPPVEVIDSLPSPRFIKTHLPLSLLPPNALDAKMVHVARDPRDAIVSLYHLMQSVTVNEVDIDFKTFWNLIITNKHPWTPYFEIIKEAWDKRNHPNMLFLFYEDMRKDLPATVRRVCDFFGKKYTEEQIAGLCEHLSFENFKKNPSVNFDIMKEIGFYRRDKDFVRKGKTGGWRDYFDEEMTTQAQKWIEDNLKDTDLRFPTI